MKVTFASVQEKVKDKGLEPVQIDGIPEGFSFKEPDVQIGDRLHEGKYIAFIPLKEWGNEASEVVSFTVEGLLKVYNEFNNGK